MTQSMNVDCGKEGGGQGRGREEAGKKEGGR